MRVLAVTPYYPPDGGGLERYAEAILGGLARRGHDVHAFSWTRGAPPQPSTGPVEVERRRAPMSIGNAPVDPHAVGLLRRSMQRLRPDVVVGHGPVPFPAEMACMAARREGIPFVLTYHSGRLRGSNLLLDGLAGAARLTLQRGLLRHSDALIAVSPFVRDHALAARRDEVHIVPPGVDAKRFRPGGKGNGKRILFLGPLDRSYRWKGVDVLWQAFEKVQDEEPDARLRLVGSGDRGTELHRRARRRTGIEVTPRLREEDVPHVYRGADVVCLPSTLDAEAFGMVLAEANACGKPVVASRIGGIPSFVEDGVNGLLVEPGDADALAERLLLLLRDPGLARRMGRAGRHKVLREHDWGVLAKRTEGVLEQVVPHRPH